MAQGDWEHRSGGSDAILDAAEHIGDVGLAGQQNNGSLRDKIVRVGVEVNPMYWTEFLAEMSSRSPEWKEFSEGLRESVDPAIAHSARIMQLAVRRFSEGTSLPLANQLFDISAISLEALTWLETHPSPDRRYSDLMTSFVKTFLRACRIALRINDSPRKGPSTWIPYLRFFKEIRRSNRLLERGVALTREIQAATQR
jgi:hypothetical protein